MLAVFIVLSIAVSLLVAVLILLTTGYSRGPRGKRGLTGRSGTTGIAGSTGIAGLAGSTGAAGLAGSTGPTGVSGASQAFSNQFVSTGGTLTTDESGSVVFVLPDPTTGAMLTLPNIVGSFGTTYDIVLAGTSTSTVIVNVDGGSYIGSVVMPTSVLVASGAVSIVFFNGLQTVGDYAQVVSNGVNWQLTAVGQQANSITAV
jgi:hypothetical protein